MCRDHLRTFAIDRTGLTFLGLAIDSSALSNASDESCQQR